MRKSIILSLSASVAFVSFLAMANGQDAGTDLERGRESYLSAGCHHCHGRAGQGARGPTMAAMKYPYEAFEFLVRKPVGGGMPAYSASQLPDAELRGIYDYLVALPGPAEETPELLR